MVCLVSILITGTQPKSPQTISASLTIFVFLDLVPIRDVASYRSYVNVVQTVGRSSGGAIGGLLAQAFGWRWCVFTQGPCIDIFADNLCHNSRTLAGQAPLTTFAMVLIAFTLQVPVKEGIVDARERNLASKLGRVDFIGSLLMSVTVLSFLLVLDIGGEKVPWASPVIFALIGVGLASGILFTFAESSWVKEPIFPLHLLSNRNVVVPYLILLLQTASQIGVSLSDVQSYQPLVSQELTVSSSSCSSFRSTSRSPEMLHLPNREHT